MNTEQTKLPIINIKPDQKHEGKAFACREIFTLDKQGKIIKHEWKREEIRDWKW